MKILCYNSESVEHLCVNVIILYYHCTVIFEVESDPSSSLVFALLPNVSSFPSS